MKPIQPKGKAPVSKDVVEVVKKKIAAPKGPPPQGMSNFNAPKMYNPGNHNGGDSYDIDDSMDEYDRERSNRPQYDDSRDDGEDFEHNTKSNRQTPYQKPNNSQNKTMDSRQRGDNNNAEFNREKFNNVREDFHAADEKIQTQTNKKMGIQDDSKNIQAKNEEFNLQTNQDDKQQQVVDNRKVVTKGPISATAGPGGSVRTDGKLVLFNFQPILRATYRELRQFVTSPCMPGITTRCYIERNRSGSKMLAPFYSICADLEDGTGRELMVCRKVMRSRSPHYIFSLKAEDLWRKREQRSRLYLGKLRASSNNVYVLYDNGIYSAPDGNQIEDDDDDDIEDEEDNDLDHKKQPKVNKKVTNNGGSATEEVSLYRKELAVIVFNTKTRPAKDGIRASEVCIPNTFNQDPSINSSNISSKPAGDSKATSTNTSYNIYKTFEKIREVGRQNDLHAKSCYVMHERTSRYDPLSSCLVDFKGRANVASVKNCQLIESSPLGRGPSVTSSSTNSQSTPVGKSDHDRDYIMQMGKTTEDCFNMDYRYPLSLLQSFAICIARFDANLTTW